MDATTLKPLMLGKSMDEVAHLLPSGGKIRHYQKGGILTMDFVADRLNIEYDGLIIIDVWNG